MSSKPLQKMKNLSVNNEAIFACLTERFVFCTHWHRFANNYPVWTEQRTISTIKLVSSAREFTVSSFLSLNHNRRFQTISSRALST